jgi:hypothetical protein
MVGLPKESVRYQEYFEMIKDGVDHLGALVTPPGRAVAGHGFRWS